MNTLCKFQDILLINLIALIIGIGAYCIFDNNIEILTAILAIGISISFGIRQYKIENDKIFKELFIAFNEKYDAKFNNVLNEIDRKTKENDSYSLAKNELNEPALIIDYLNLCAEEYLWYRKGRINKIVWDAWEAGMIYYMNIDPIRSLILSEKKQADSYYGLFKKIGPSIKGWK